MASKRSDIWKFFQICEENQEKTKCNLCDILLSYKGNTTKTMWNHLKAKHAHAMAGMKETVEKKFGCLKQPSISTFAAGGKFSKEKQEECYKAAANVCAADLRPLGMFHTVAYRKYMAKVQPGYTPPVAATVKKYLNLQYLREKSALKDDLLKQVSVALTTDLWTSMSTQSYLTVTGHYISEDWVLKHCVLATKRITGRHTGENIYEALASIQTEYNIENKVAGITSDNAANMKAAVSRQKFSTCDRAYCQCFAHTLQLAIEDGLKQKPIENTAIAARKLVGHFNRSCVASDALEEYQKREGVKPLKLIQDVATRWNSLYLMFDRLVKLRSAVYYVLHEKKYTKPNECAAIQLSEDQWSLIEELIPVLSPLAEATEVLSTEEYPSCSSIMPMLLSLMRYDLEVKEHDSEVVGTLKNKTVNGLRSRNVCPDDPEFPVSAVAVATFLDPRYKGLRFINTEEVKFKIKCMVLDLIRAVETDAREQVSPVKKRKTVSSYLDGDYVEETSDRNVESEMLRYESEPVLIKNPLDWWRHYAVRFPKLAKLAREFLCIMGTSVPSERVFSVAGLTLTKSRNKLDSDVVDEIIFLNKVLHQKYKMERKGITEMKIKTEPGVSTQASTAVCEPVTPQLPSLY